MKQALHQRNVQPSIELTARLALDADQFEATASVQGSGCFARGLDSCEHCVETAARGNIEEFGEQERADSLAGSITTDIDRVFDAGAVGRPLAVGRQRGEPHDLAAGGEVLGDDRRKRS